MLCVAVAQFNGDVCPAGARRESGAITGEGARHSRVVVAPGDAVNAPVRADLRGRRNRSC